MTVDLVLAGNGPGELTGWVRPVAHAARKVGGSDLRVTLVLSPTQFAGGREEAVVRSWGIFDRVVPTAQAVRVALGVAGLKSGPQGTVVHLGGDLWFSARLARRLSIPACALAETPLIARRHRRFARVFAASRDLAERLARLGVPKEKIVVTGDPRADAIAEAVHTESPSSLNHSLRSGAGQAPPSPHRGEGNRVGYVVSILPGSRDRFFRELVPYFLDAAAVLRTQLPDVEFRVICSSFLTPELVTDSKHEASRRWPNLPVQWVTDDMWPVLTRSDLALTIPGTNTVELAMAGIPYAAVLPLEKLGRAPAEGLLEWVGRIPGVGELIKSAGLRRYLARHPLVTLPNMKAGRMIAPEFVGRWTSMDLAKRLAEVLRDENRRTAMSRELRQLYAGATGAARTIALAALELATRGTQS